MKTAYKGCYKGNCDVLQQSLMTWQSRYAPFRLRSTRYLPFWLMSHWFCCQFWTNNFSCKCHVTNHPGATGNYIITVISWWHHKDTHGLKGLTRELWRQRQNFKYILCLSRATTPDHSHIYQQSCKCTRSTLLIKKGAVVVVLLSSHTIPICKQATKLN